MKFLRLALVTVKIIKHSARLHEDVSEALEEGIPSCKGKEEKM